MEIIRVSVGTAVIIGERRGRPWSSAIDKASVGATRVPVGPLGLEGDEQQDRRYHGGPHQAVYAYADEDLAFWTDELGRTIDSTLFGQNLTTHGVDVTAVVVGERWRVGTTVLEATGPRIPCAKLARRIGEPGFVKRFAAAGRPGAYFRVLEPGTVGAGDSVERLHRPEGSPSVATVMQIVLVEHDRADELSDLAGLNPALSEWARARE